MKVRVEDDKCQGHTICAMQAPEIFTLSEYDGHSEATGGEVPAELEGRVIDAVRSCPEQAIMIIRHSEPGTDVPEES